MKVGKHNYERDTKEMADEHLKREYYELIQDQTVANAVMAVLLKLEIERRISEKLEQEKMEYIVSEYESKIVREI